MLAQFKKYQYICKVVNLIINKQIKTKDMENKGQVVVLEPSTNTHQVQANSIEKTNIDESILKLKIKGNGIVTHGEHGTLVTESANVVKYVQQEFNPITRKLQNAFD